MSTLLYNDNQKKIYNRYINLSKHIKILDQKQKDITFYNKLCSNSSIEITKYLMSLGITDNTIIESMIYSSTQFFTRIRVFAPVSVGFLPFPSFYTAFCFLLKKPHLIVFICIPKSSNVLVKVTMCFQNGFSLVNGRSKFMAVSKPPQVGCIL